ncbi:MAG: hypothetical protein NZM04_01735 [Methylacidiphilales bacterium]|nr:hypothetical protein [Candidatus Methylacidiphilales bacterium]
MCKDLYEFRIGLHRRALFTHQDDYLYLHFIGNHDQVARFLRTL